MSLAQMMRRFHLQFVSLFGFDLGSLSNIFLSVPFLFLFCFLGLSPSPLIIFLTKFQEVYPVKKSTTILPLSRIDPRISINWRPL
jgi:hypothetical protein